MIQSFGLMPGLMDVLLNLSVRKNTWKSWPEMRPTKTTNMERAEITFCLEVSVIYLSILNTAIKASCGISTFPTAFILFFPSFCFSSSFLFLEISPP